MKKTVTATTSVLIICSALALAEGASRLGAHVGLTAGGDAEDNCFLYGIHGAMPLTDRLSVELAIANIRDDDAVDTERDATIQSLDLELWNLAFSLRATGYLSDLLGEQASAVLPAAESTGFYAGGGAAYNVFEGESDELDDNLGFQVFLGLEVETGQFGEMFLEYRYNIIELDAVDLDEDHDIGAVRFGASLKF